MSAQGTTSAHSTCHLSMWDGSAPPCCLNPSLPLDTSVLSCQPTLEHAADTCIEFAELNRSQTHFFISLLSPLFQEHAADTYIEFAEQNRALLETIPPPLVALNYYKVSCF